MRASLFRVIAPAVLALLAAGSCAERRGSDRASAGPGEAGRGADVRADSARSLSLPPARVPGGPAPPTRVRIASSSGMPPPALPEPEPGAPAPAAGGEGLVTDDALRPPIARASANFTIPGPRRGALELDLRVDENGEVTDAVPVMGDADDPLTRAAISAALGARYYPATRAGRAVAVWCRQRIEVRPR